MTVTQSHSHRRLIQVFVSSPGDVADERALCHEVISGLMRDPSIRQSVYLEPIAWDRPGSGATMLASLSPQDAINDGLPSPSECDIVIVILWSRMGTDLKSPYLKPDGTPYTGTEWEYHDALNASLKTGRPLVLVYRRTEHPTLDLSNLDTAERQIRDLRRVADFFNVMGNEAGYNPYKSPGEFKERLDHDLRKVIQKLLTGKMLRSLNADSQTQQLWDRAPFPGLRAFRSDEYRIFFGREAETDDLIRRLRSPGVRFLLVVGASGSGKSSLISAGLVPRLANDAIEDSSQWTLVRFTPSVSGNDSDPLEALAAEWCRLMPDAVGLDATALTNRLKRGDVPDVPLLLFMDQLEELLTVVREQRRAPLLDFLRHALEKPHIRLIATLRADFHQQFLEIGEFKSLDPHVVQLFVPDRAALRRMVTKPAESAGVLYEDEALIERILDDTGRDPGALALMAFVLEQLYKRAFDNVNENGAVVLTHRDYEELGGVQGAIGKRAMDAFHLLAAHEQDAERALYRVFRELLVVNAAGEATRKRVPRSHFSADADPTADKLVEAFIEARLLVTDMDRQSLQVTVEVAHEALFRGWDQLAQWIKEHATDFQVIQRAVNAAAEWDAAGRPGYLLWYHEALEPVYRARSRLAIEFDPIVSEFIRPEYERLMENYAYLPAYRQGGIGYRLTQIGLPAMRQIVIAYSLSVDQSMQNDIVDSISDLLFKSPKGWEALISLLDDVDAGVQETAARMMRSMIDPGYARRGTEVIQKYRRDLVELARSGNSRPNRILKDHLNKFNSRFVNILLTLLHESGDADAAAIARTRLYHDDFDVRFSALDLLLRFDPADLESVLETYFQESPSDIRRDTVRALKVWPDPRAVKLIRPRLTDASSYVRLDAIEALTLLEDRESLIMVRTLLNDPDPLVRQAALVHLRELRDTSALADIRKALDTPNDDVCIAAIDTLETLEDRESLPIFRVLLGDASAYVRQRSAQAIGILRDPEAEAALRECLRDENAVVREAARYALARIGIIVDEGRKTGSARSSRRRPPRPLPTPEDDLEIPRE
ncbi:MAG: HEAT repeat domain-containing protein [Anaerolineae bacterium]